MIAQFSPAAVRTGEESVLAIERNGSDGAFDDIGVDLDAAVVDKAGQALPARERIADRLGELGLLADERQLFAQPGLQRVEDRPGFLLARWRGALRRRGRGSRSRWRRAAPMRSSASLAIGAGPAAASS